MSKNANAFSCYWEKFWGFTLIKINKNMSGVDNTLINPKNTKAIVTGAAGFIGQALVAKLMTMDIDVTSIDVNPVAQQKGKLLILDITRPKVLDDLLANNTVIFHLAARASVPGSVKDPEDDFTNTLYGLFQVLESARKYNCQVIFPSTASIFDVNNKLPVSEKAYVKPSSPYGAAKVAGESYCYAYHRSYGLDVRVARMFSVYGIGMYRFAIHDMVRKIQQNNKELIILGDGQQIRDYLYIDDVVNGLIRISSYGKSGEDYNLASGEQIKIIDLAKKIALLMKVPEIKIIPTGESFKGDVPKWYADITKIKKIGFNPTISLDEGLTKTINWLNYRSKKWI